MSRAKFADRLEDLLRAPGPGAGGPAPVMSAAEPEAVDLCATALPVLLRKAAVPAAATLLAVVLVRTARRRSRG